MRKVVQSNLNNCLYSDTQFSLYCMSSRKFSDQNMLSGLGGGGRCYALDSLDSCTAKTSLVGVKFSFV